jgi:catechol 2,3-dioxygenase-like lactoylglutathione lyase family enzyme
MKTNSLFLASIIAMAAPAAGNTQQLFDKITMTMITVADMDRAKEFYAGKLGFSVVTDYGSGDRHWVNVAPPGGGSTLTLSTYRGDLKPGAMQFYLSTKDIQAARKALVVKGVKAGDIGDDLYGPGSGVKWFQLADPDGNTWIVWQE